MTDTLGYWAATSWESGATDALSDIDYQSRLIAARRHHRPVAQWSLNGVQKAYEDYANAYYAYPDEWPIMHHYTDMGAEAWLQVPMSINIAVQILANKQRDYGHDNILRFGHTGLVVRLHDKIARLQNLLDKDDDRPRNEAVTDTWFDIVGYCVIGIMLLDATFEREVSDDN